MTPASKNFAFSLLVLIGALFCGPSYAGEQPQLGSRYKIVGPVYLSGVYSNLNDRQLNNQLASGYLSAVQSSGPEIAFQHIVPIGTTMTIIVQKPKAWWLPFGANHYLVRLDPDISRGLNVLLVLNIGIDGSLDGLNPELFSRLENSGSATQ